MRKRIISFFVCMILIMTVFGMQNVAATDTDGDGMPDWWEILHGLNPNDPSDALDDNDGDGLINLDEYINGTDPFDPDTDGDGLNDGDEVHLYGTDPLTPNKTPKKLYEFPLIYQITEGTESQPIIRFRIINNVNHPISPFYLSYMVKVRVGDNIFISITTSDPTMFDTDWEYGIPDGEIYYYFTMKFGANLPIGEHVDLLCEYLKTRPDSFVDELIDISPQPWPTIDMDYNQIDDDLEFLVSTSAPNDPLDVIIMFRDPVTYDLNIGISTLSSYAGTPFDIWPLINAIHGLIPAGNFYSYVGSIKENLEFIQFNNEASANLWFSTQQVRARPVVWDDPAYGYTGTPFYSVAVVDTGIDDTHPDLVNQYLWAGGGPLWADFAGASIAIPGDNYPTPTDVNGHGTHCAGIIAGNGASGTVTNVIQSSHGFFHNLPWVTFWPPYAVYLPFDAAVGGHITGQLRWNGGGVGGVQLHQILANGDYAFLGNIAAVGPSPLNFNSAVLGNLPSGNYGIAFFNDGAAAGMAYEANFQQIVYPTTIDARNEIVGIAYTSGIVGVKALDDNGAGDLASVVNSIIQVINWHLIDLHEIPAASMSLGGGTMPAVIAAVTAMAQNGIVPVVAAGNDFGRVPGGLPIGSPGDTPLAITVGAVNELDEVSWYSSNGAPAPIPAKPDVVAPGGSQITRSIMSVDSNDADIALPTPDNDYTAMYGTSMATPHVSGEVALIIEAVTDTVAATGIDNDNDGVINEDPWDGINNDGDSWGDDPAGTPDIYDTGIDEVIIDVNVNGVYDFFVDTVVFEGATPGVDTAVGEAITALIDEDLAPWNYIQNQVNSVKSVVSMATFEVHGGEIVPSWAGNPGASNAPGDFGADGIPPGDPGDNPADPTQGDGITDVLNRATVDADGFVGKDRKEGYGRVAMDGAIEAVTMPWNYKDTEIRVTLGPDPTDKKVMARRLDIGPSRVTPHTFVLRVPDTADYDLYIYDYTPLLASGDPIVHASSTNPGMGDDEYVEFLPPAEGSYYIVVKWVQGTGEFQLVEWEPPLPPENLRIDVDSADRNNVIISWDASPSILKNYYELYRSTTRVFDFSTPYVTLWATLTEFTDIGVNDPTHPNYNQEYFYALRTVDVFNRIGTTTYTVGKYTKDFDVAHGYDEFSLPLEPFETHTVDWYVDEIGCVGMNWFDYPAQRWIWHRYTMPPGVYDTDVIMGECYQVSLDPSLYNGPYTFVGTPGGSYRYKDFAIAAPTGFIISVSASGNDIDLNWNQVADANYYNIYRSSSRPTVGNPGFDFTAPIHSTTVGDPTDTTWTDIGAASVASEYYYMVMAVSIVGIEGPSTMSHGEWTREFTWEINTFGLTLSPYTIHTVHWYCCLEIPNTEYIDYYVDGSTVTHWFGDPEENHDVLICDGFEIGIDPPPSKYTFIGT